MEQKKVLEQRIKELLPFCDFPIGKRKHNYLGLPIELRHLQKKGRDVEERLRLLSFPEKIGNQRVLDLGCNLGSFTIEALKRGASYALGIDCWESNVKCLRFMLEYYSFKDRGEVWDKRLTDADFEKLATMEFDYVFALSIIKHLKEARSAFWKFAHSVKKKIYFEGHNKKEAKHYFKEIPQSFWDLFEVESEHKTNDRGLRTLLVFKRKNEKR